MARYRGTVKGGRGEGSRLGHATSGLRLHANSWNGSVEVQLFVNRDNDEDWASVRLTTGDGRGVPLYHGPLSKYQPVRNRQYFKVWNKGNPSE